MAIYVLALEGGRFYIGVTENVVKTFQEHLNGSVNCPWTQKHKPLRIEEVLRSGNQDGIVKKYMRMYGINYVRGGSYQEDEISEKEQAHLLAELWPPHSIYKKPVTDFALDGVNVVRTGISSVFGAVSDVFGTVRDVIKPVDTETTQREYFRN
jgi:predicted GIY-YIG superfamily endonuclease